MGDKIKILMSAETKDGMVFLEEEPYLKTMFGIEARFCTHAGKSPENRYWGHYCMSYDDAYEDYIKRIARGF